MIQTNSHFINISIYLQ